ncbi:hypothetical protein IFM89_016979 [Coptis chinensis]|uniref:CASP-like protein n=1 Tax=Coptis chinensis TaxID=261450 RepID=A0A835HVZ5_9MAGN|nr:hypothetical protein IFM89_016979 [Coptis chinensis]
MASADERSSKVATESQIASTGNRTANFFPVDLTLRILLFVSSLAAIVVMVTSKQTELVQVPLIPIKILNTAKFDQLPAFNTKAYPYMASADEHSRKIAPESQIASTGNRSANFFPVDLTLRILLFVSSLAAVIVMVTSKQTELVQVPSIPFKVPNTAKFDQTPAFIIISILASLVRKHRSTKLLFHFILIDTLMIGIVASATGTAGGVAYIGLKGNSHVRWGKVCNIYDTFCRHVGSSVALSLFSSILLVILVMLSTYTLYRRSC